MRTLTLRCGHPQESRAQAGSTVDCRTCGQHCKVTRAMVAAAEGKSAAAPARAARPARQRHAAAPDRPVWNPPAVPRVTPRPGPGACECGTPMEWGLAGHATMGRCPACKTWALPRAVTAAAAGGQRQGQGGKRPAAEALYVRAEHISRLIRAELAGGGLVDEDAGRLRLALDDTRAAVRDRSPSRLGDVEEYLRDLGWLDGDGQWDGAAAEDGEPEVLDGEVIAEDWDDPAAGDGRRPAGQVIDGAGLVLGRRDDIDVLLRSYRDPPAQDQGTRWPAWASSLPRPPRSLPAEETVPEVAAGPAASVTQQLLAGDGLARVLVLAEAEFIAGVRRAALIQLGEETGQPPTYQQLTGYQFTPPAPKTAPGGILSRSKHPTAITSPAGADPAAGYFEQWDIAATAAARQAGTVMERASTARARRAR